jgi:hypothetical protein
MRKIAVRALPLLALLLSPPAAQGAGEWESLDGNFAQAPSCVRTPEQLNCVARDGGNARINSLTAAGWSGWTAIGGAIASDPSCIAPAPNRLTCFARGTDNALWRATRIGPRLKDWEKMGGEMTEAPSCVSAAENRLSCFVRGTDALLYRLDWDGTAWRGWFGVSLKMLGTPQCLAGAAGRIECFARTSERGDMAHITVEDGKWSAIDELGGEFRGPPSCIKWTSVGLNCFVQGTDNKLYHAWWNGAAWGGWEGLGGALAAPPSCVSAADGRVDCFVLGEARAMWRRRWDGDKWLDWENLGGEFTAAPSCVAAAGVADCFAPGAGGAILHRRLAAD